MITKLKLTNFTVFDELNIDFSPKINIIIGENGTGKTQLLKAGYALSTNNKISDSDIETSLTSRLLKLYMPMDDKIGKMKKYGTDEIAKMKITFDSEKSFECSFNHNSRNIAVQENNDYFAYISQSTYIPTKEVLSFMKGFTSLYENYKLSFDQTYFDICSLLDLPEIHEDKLHVKSRWAMNEIEVICGGKFKFYGGGKVTFIVGDDEYSANSMAEGFRKAGMISRLLETGAIAPGITGTLFWDEPETNMNPKLMRLFVEILLELSRNGQQIVIATHDYVFLKWFDLLKNEAKDDHIRFHVLYKDNLDSVIKLQSTDSYIQIEPNAISDTFNDITKEQVKLKMAGLGQ
ncbi:AAA family ATPase [Sulfuricurvum sp.]|uniref:AAA family ATPase n=1 Tax=Sulfuricurvum sp. TaxID=2025608 RepID=UPI00262D6792|nr:AAA family ATPase [Sulfuricurvum sp.]MDD4950489.1 AAA family ATPase [Sulfuricurvum sp.]